MLHDEQHRQPLGQQGIDAEEVGSASRPTIMPDGHYPAMLQVTAVDDLTSAHSQAVSLMAVRQRIRPTGSEQQAVAARGQLQILVGRADVPSLDQQIVDRGFPGPGLGDIVEILTVGGLGADGLQKS